MQVCKNYLFNFSFSNDAFIHVAILLFSSVIESKLYYVVLDPYERFYVF